jgi:hypothetical protein
MMRLAQILFVLALLGCGSKDAGGHDTPSRPATTGSASAAGRWVTDEGATTLVLGGDGAFVMDTKKGQHVTGTWILDGTTLSMTGGGEGAISGSFSGTLEDGVLKIRMGPKEVVYERD